MRASASAHRRASGLSVIKAARKTGRIGAELSGTVVRAVRESVDAAALKGAFTRAALLRPALAVRAAREAVKVDKAGGLLHLVRDVGRVQGSAGTRAALDAVKLADHPRDVARLARLAEGKGLKTRAIIKLLGRGAILLTCGDVQPRRMDLLGHRQPGFLLRCDQARHGTHDVARDPCAQGPRSARAACGGGTGRLTRHVRRVTHATFPARVGGDRLSRRGGRRSDHPGARVCVHQRGELASPGLDRDPHRRRPPRHRARQSRPRRVVEALRSGGLSHRDDGRGRGAR